MQYASTDHITKSDIEQIRSLNLVTNQGRGSTTVRSILHSMDRGDFFSAAVELHNEFDKIRQYPEMAELLRQIFRVSYI